MAAIRVNPPGKPVKYVMLGPASPKPPDRERRISLIRLPGFHIEEVQK